MLDFKFNLGLIGYVIFFVLYFTIFIIFKIVKIDKIYFLKLFLDGLENLIQNFNSKKQQKHVFEK